MKLRRLSHNPYELERRILTRLAEQLNLHYRCRLDRDSGIRFKDIEGLIVTTTEDKDGLHHWVASYMGRRNGLTIEHFALDEFDRLLNFVGACSLSASKP